MYSFVFANLQLNTHRRNMWVWRLEQSTYALLLEVFWWSRKGNLLCFSGFCAKENWTTLSQGSSSDWRPNHVSWFEKACAICSLSQRSGRQFCASSVSLVAVLQKLCARAPRPLMAATHCWRASSQFDCVSWERQTSGKTSKLVSAVLWQWLCLPLPTL